MTTRSLPAALPALVAAAALAASAAGPAIASELRYRVTDLGTPAGFLYSVPTGLNNRGEVVGRTWGGNMAGPMGFLSSGGSLGYTPDHAVAWGINDSGTLTTSEHLSSINNRGDVAGAYEFWGSSGGSSTVAYTSGHGALLSHDIDRRSRALDLNDHGQVVGIQGGNDSGPDGQGGLFLFDDGEVIDLGIVGVSNHESRATSINNNGVIAGTQQGRAFRWEDGQVTPLGTLDGGETRAEDINDDGWVVGSSRLGRGISYIHPETGVRTYTSDIRGFLDIGDEMFDLNDLVPPSTEWTIRDAVAINESGQIAAVGVREGVSRALLLTPVPEPGPIAVLVLSGAAGAWRARRRWGLGHRP
jgi:probable HAF family extracellular repeat protein